MGIKKGFGYIFIFICVLIASIICFIYYVKRRDELYKLVNQTSFPLELKNIIREISPDQLSTIKNVINNDTKIMDNKYVVEQFTTLLTSPIAVPNDANINAVFYYLSDIQIYYLVRYKFLDPRISLILDKAYIKESSAIDSPDIYTISDLEPIILTINNYIKNTQDRTPDKERLALKECYEQNKISCDSNIVLPYNMDEQLQYFHQHFNVDLIRTQKYLPKI